MPGGFPNICNLINCHNLSDVPPGEAEVPTGTWTTTSNCALDDGTQGVLTVTWVQNAEQIGG
jgi:hypothetical protein